MSFEISPTVSPHSSHSSNGFDWVSKAASSSFSALSEALRILASLAISKWLWYAKCCESVEPRTVENWLSLRVAVRLLSDGNGQLVWRF